jgi:hypothetical protein
MRTRHLASLALLAVGLAYPAPAAAHRLDEYLQASRISVDPDRVTIEIDLTPGASVASRVLSWLDTDRDGVISAREEDQYARDVVGSLTLLVDGQSTAIRLLEARFPDVSDFGRGVGTIRLRAEAMIPVMLPGRHSLSYDNAHRPATSVYLVNAVVPADPRVVIAGQHRDPTQHRLTVDCDMTSSMWVRVASVAAGLAIIGVLIVARRPGLAR